MNTFSVLVKKEIKKLFLCEYCGSVYPSHSSIRLHLRKHGEKYYGCDECDKKFFRKDMLRQHKATHLECTWECSECKKKFQTKQILLNHHRNVHSFRFACSVCDKKFSLKSACKKHMKKHDSGCIFKCHSCKQTFNNKKNLEQHIFKAHGNNAPFQCSHCSRTYARKSELNRHVRFEHVVKFICSFCGMNIAYPNALKKHLKSKHQDRVDEWNFPEALQAMMRPTNNSRSQVTTDSTKIPEPTTTSTSKDILASATESAIKDGSFEWENYKEPSAINNELTDMEAGRSSDVIVYDPQIVIIQQLSSLDNGSIVQATTDSTKILEPITTSKDILASATVSAMEDGSFEWENYKQSSGINNKLSDIESGHSSDIVVDNSTQIVIMEPFSSLGNQDLSIFNMEEVVINLADPSLEIYGSPIQATTNDCSAAHTENFLSDYITEIAMPDVSMPGLVTEEDVSDLMG